MLHKCANAACSVAFRRLSEGKLFQVETALPEDQPLQRTGHNRKARSLRKVEHFWLCDDCCSHLTLVFEKDRGIVTIPIPMPQRKRPAASINATVSSSLPFNQIRAVR
ncbi:MAG TPA: hypothetical protein VFA68_03480 [Terriglobales bacterium]|nr:hypothetical protein [Terriglobales bacterium]